MKIAINLLPPEQKDALHKRIVFRLLMEQLVYVIIIIGILFAGLLTIHLLLRSDITSAEDKIMQQEQAEDYRDVQEALTVFKETNLDVRKMQQLQSGHVSWTPALRLLTDSIPRSVNVTSFITEDTLMTISGVARTRDDVVLLKKAIDSAKIGDAQCFTKTLIPDESLVAAANSPFSLQLTISEDCLKAY